MVVPIVTGGSEFQVNTFGAGALNPPAIAVLAGGDFIVSWQSYNQDGSSGGIYAQRYDAAGAAQGGEFRVNTTTEGNQGAPAIAALASGGFVVSWSSIDADGQGYDTFAQRYDAAGATQGGEFRINTFTTGDQSFSAATGLAAGGFVVSWQSFGEDAVGSGGIYARHYDDAGVAQGGVFRVNTDTASNQRYPTVTGLEDGGFVFSWESGGQDGSGYGIYAQVYDAGGIARGGEFRVNSVTTSDQGLPVIAALDGGGFVVTWNSLGQDGGDYGVYAQRYDAAGVAQGGEFRVNSFTAGNQYYPTVTGLEGGGFVVTWESQGQDGSGAGIYAQFYDATGTAKGGEFLVNAITAGDQFEPAIAALADGGFVVSWPSRDADGDYEIHARIFAVNTAPVAVDDMATATEDVSTPLWNWVLMNDGDPDGGALTIVAVDTTGTYGRVVLDSATHTLNYVADTAFFDGLPPGVDVIDTFTYTVADPDGETSTATVVLNVTTTLSGVILVGTEGDDVLNGGEQRDNLDGRGGNDTLSGFGENDTLIGGTGNDRLIGGEGADVLDGGQGRDTASYRGAAAGVTASLTTPADNSGEAAGDTYVGIENLEGSAFDDVLGGNADANDFFGGDGDDMVSYAWAASGVVASLSNATTNPSPTTQTGDAAGDRYTSIEMLEGSDFADTLRAAAGGSALYGRDGDDALYGLGGSDTLVGGAGLDLLIGDGGADTLYGGDDADTLRGDAGADQLFGEDGADTLDGGAGFDILDGGAGNDTLTGGAGGDYFAIRDLGGTDTVTDFKRAQGDKIDLRDLNIDEWIGTQAFHNDAGEVRIRNEGAQWWLEGDVNGDGIADFSVAMGNVQLIASDIMFG